MDHILKPSPQTSLPVAGLPEFVIGPLGIMVRIFTNCPGDRGSIPGQVIPKTLKMTLDAALLNIQHYKVRMRSKWSNSGKEVVPSSTPRCSSYWKGSLRVAPEYSRPIYYICIYIHIWCVVKSIAVFIETKDCASAVPSIFNRSSLMRLCLVSWTENLSLG